MLEQNASTCRPHQAEVSYCIALPDIMPEHVTGSHLLPGTPCGLVLPSPTASYPDSDPEQDSSRLACRWRLRSREY